MEQVQPWIWSACQSYLQQTEPSTSILNPSNPIRTGNIQFIRFFSKHSFKETNSQKSSIWAEGIDKHLKVYIEITDEVLNKFEQDQGADQRGISSLNFPVFSLGGCRWIWDIPPTFNLNSNIKNDHQIKPKVKQLCLKIVNELPKKKFKFKAELPSKIPILNQENQTGSLIHQLRFDQKGLMFLAAAQLELQMRNQILSHDDSSIAEKQVSEFARGIVRIPIIRRSTKNQRKKKNDKNQQDTKTTTIQTNDLFQDNLAYFENRSFNRFEEVEGNERRIYDLSPFAEIDQPKEKAEISKSLHDLSVHNLLSTGPSSSVQLIEEPRRKINRFTSDDGNINIPIKNTKSINQSTRASPSDKLQSLRASSSFHLRENPTRETSRIPLGRANTTIPNMNSMKINQSTRDSPSVKLPSLRTPYGFQSIEKQTKELSRFPPDRANTAISSMNSMKINQIARDSPSDKLQSLRASSSVQSIEKSANERSRATSNVDPINLPSKTTKTIKQSTRDSPSDGLPSLRASSSVQLIENPTRETSRIPPGRSSTAISSMNSIKINQIARDSTSDKLQSLRASSSVQSIENPTRETSRIPPGRANTAIFSMNSMKINQIARDSPPDKLPSLRASRSVQLMGKPTSERGRAKSDEGYIIIPTKNTMAIDSELTRINHGLNHVGQQSNAPKRVERVENSRNSIDQTYAEKTNLRSESNVVSNHPKHTTLAYASKSVSTTTRQLRSSMNPDIRSSNRLKSIKQRLESIPIGSVGIESSTTTKSVRSIQNESSSKRKIEEVTRNQKEFVAARRRALMRNVLNSSKS